MKRLDKFDDNKVIEMNRLLEEEPEEKSMHLPVTRILLAIILIILLAVGVIFLGCPIKKIHVDGLKTYTREQILESLEANDYISNSVFLKLQNQLSPLQSLPFVEKVRISINDRNTITLHVKEKHRAGCIAYAGEYVYFDKDGYALESLGRHLDDIPIITGISFKKIDIGEKLPVKKDYFKRTIVITSLINKNEILIDEIVFKEDESIALKKGDLDIVLGSDENMDAKINILPGVLESLKKEKGTIYLDRYTKENKIITFRKKK